MSSRVAVYEIAKRHTAAVRLAGKWHITFKPVRQERGQPANMKAEYREKASGPTLRAGDTIHEIIVQATNNCLPAILAEAVKLAEAAELRAAQAAEHEAREVLETIDKGDDGEAVQ